MGDYSYLSPRYKALRKRVKEKYGFATLSAADDFIRIRFEESELQRELSVDLLRNSDKPRENVEGVLKRLLGGGTL